jgi:uncharacterized protein YjbI with pentapeptide repeats
MKTLLRLSYVPPFALAAMFVAFAAGCGGGGSNPATTSPPPGGEQKGWGEGQLTAGIRLKPASVVAINLEAKGQSDEQDTGGDGEDRIPYRLDKPTRLVVEMNPDDPMYITLIASETGKLVFEVGPENPKVEMELPAADYDLYLHSTSGETRSVFVQGREETTRSSYNTYLLATSGYCGDCDFRFAQLYNIKAKGADIRGAKFTNAILDNCDFEGANVSNAVFSYAQIDNVNLAGANLTDTSFIESRIDRLDLTAANLTRSGFLSSSVLRSTFDRSTLDRFGLKKTTVKQSSAVDLDFGNTSFEEVQFDDVRMPKAQFIQARIYGNASKFLNCNLTGANLTGFAGAAANLIIEKSDLTGAKLTGLNLDTAFMSTNNLTNADLAGTKLPARITGGRMAGAKLPGVKLANARWEKTDLSGADMSKAEINGMFFTDCTMKGIRLDKVRLNTVDFDRCDLTDAAFTGTVDMFQINFNACDLTRSDFTYAWLKANFRSSVMRNATMVQAYLNGTTFEGTDFSSANLRRTNFSGTTDLGRNTYTDADFSGSIWDNGQRICAEGSIGACK